MEGFERTGRKIVVVSQCRCSFYHEANCRGHTECIEAGSGHGLLLYVSVLLFVLKTNDRFWQKKRDSSLITNKKDSLQVEWNGMEWMDVSAEPVYVVL